MFRHLVALCVEHQTGRNHVFEGDRVEHHRGDGVEREEPAARLINALVNEVGGESQPLVDGIAVFKRIVHLRVGHGTRVEPHVDEVALALHRLAVGGCQHDFIDIRTMQVDSVVVRLRHIAWHETLVFQRVRRHYASLDSLFDFVVKFLDRPDAFLGFALFVAPNRQWCTPETATRKVPVVQVFEPVAKSARSRGFGMPADGLVQLGHTLLLRRRADKPRIERIVEHGLVGAPAMGIVVDVFLNFKHLALHLQIHADGHVERLVFFRKVLVVGVLHETACKLLPLVDIHILTYEFFI